MKELFIFQLRYRKKVWIICTLMSTMMVSLFSATAEKHSWFMLLLVLIYSGLLDKMGAKKNIEEFIPRLAHPREILEVIGDIKHDPHEVLIRASQSLGVKMGQPEHTGFRGSIVRPDNSSDLCRHRG